MLKRFRAHYSKQAFAPGVLGVFVNPFYLARSALYRVISDFAKCLEGRLLDVGCGSKPYRSLFNVSEYIGLDIDSPITRKLAVADVLYDGRNFPFNDNGFDVILCNQVLEHVFNPVDFLSEIHRVLKPGGKLLLSVPFVWDEHEQPWDYARYSSFGLAVLLQRSGLKIIEHRKLRSDVSAIFQLTNAYLFKITQRWPRPVIHMLTASVMAVITILGIIGSRLFPHNPDLYLDHVVLAEKCE